MAKNISAKQQDFILQFLQSGSIKDSCQKTGIVKQTYYNWLCNPAFKRELKKQQENHYENSLSVMKNLFSAAVETHMQLLKSDNESIRLRAANAIINRNSRILEAIEHRERIKNLERKVGEDKKIPELEVKCNELNSDVKQKKN